MHRVRFSEENIALPCSLRYLVYKRLNAKKYPLAYIAIAQFVARHDAQRSRWFKYAAAINGNKSTFVARFVRFYTLQAAGRYIDFQEASDSLARRVLSQTLVAGIPVTRELMQVDTLSAVRSLGLHSRHYAAKADLFNLLGTYEFYRTDLVEIPQILARTILAALSLFLCKDRVSCLFS